MLLSLVILNLLATVISIAFAIELRSRSTDMADQIADTREAITTLIAVNNSLLAQAIVRLPKTRAKKAKTEIVEAELADLGIELEPESGS
jgi:predicted membrane chloride channel (bestrophin family)